MNFSFPETTVVSLLWEAPLFQNNGAGNPFTRQYVFFSRAGFTGPAQTLARLADAILVSLYDLDAVLAGAIR